MSGVATTASKSIQPPRIFSTTSSPPTGSAPASWASFCLSGWRSRARACSCPARAAGRRCHAPSGRACFGSTPRRIASFDRLVELRELQLLHQRQRLFQRVGPSSTLRLGCRRTASRRLRMSYLRGATRPRWLRSHSTTAASTWLQAVDANSVRSADPICYPTDDVESHRARRAGDVFMADSSESVFRSGSFSFAISSTCLRSPCRPCSCSARPIPWRCSPRA